MPSSPTETPTPRYESYCLHCQAPAADEARACTRCGARFEGCGHFDKVAGPRPSGLFLALFEPMGHAA